MTKLTKKTLQALSIKHRAGRLMPPRHNHARRVGTLHLITA